MKEFINIILKLFIATAIYQSAYCQQIKFKDHNFSNVYIALAYHYADGIYKLEEVNTDKNGFAFFSSDSLKTGIYYILLPDSSSYEFLYDSDFDGEISISGNSSENGYRLNAPPPTALYSQFLSEINTSERPSQKHKDKIIEKYILKDTDSFLSIYLKTMQRIHIPAYIPPAETVNKDSAIWHYKILYYQKHYLDHLDLSDTRLINTPVYTEKMNDFLDKMTSQNEKQLIKALDFVIGKSKKNQESLEFVANYLLVKYYQKKNTPLYEVVYLHLIKNYYLDGGYSWVTNEQISTLTREYNRHFPASIGQPAPNVSGIKPDENTISLGETMQDYTILFFYDYDCSICNRIIPNIVRLTETFEYLNLNVFAVCLGTDKDNWLSFISKNKVTPWINVFHSEPGSSSPSILYNLSFTPSVFLLNKDKTIIGKNLNISQLEDLLLKEALSSNK